MDCFQIGIHSMGPQIDLRESTTMTSQNIQMNTNKRKKRVHLRLLIFSLFPVFLNLLFLIPEVWKYLSIKQAFQSRGNYEKSKLVCNWDNIVNRGDLIELVDLLTPTTVMFSYYIGYLVLYPNIRKAFTGSGKEN